jgi:phage tail protein X
MTGFTRPKRFCVPENRNYTAVKTKELDALESSCEKLYAERDALRELLREANPYLKKTGWGAPGTDLPDRIDAALAKEKP